MKKNNSQQVRNDRSLNVIGISKEIIPANNDLLDADTRRGSNREKELEEQIEKHKGALKFGENRLKVYYKNPNKKDEHGKIYSSRADWRLKQTNNHIRIKIQEKEARLNELKRRNKEVKDVINNWFDADTTCSGRPHCLVEGCDLCVKCFDELIKELGLEDKNE